MLVVYAPGVDHRADEQEWKPERANMVGGQHPEPDTKDDRTHARREFGPSQPLRPGGDHSRFP